MFRRQNTQIFRSFLNCKRFITIFDAVESKSLLTIPIDDIRNFSVIAHVDHGKSTLSDALLSFTGNITEFDRKKGQVLDTLKVERERGITVKANTASMIYVDHRTERRYLLNLIDTPGHIDFSYEGIISECEWISHVLTHCNILVVSRSLASCQGALLLVDSTQSVQAQTLANFEKAKQLGLSIIPVVTKIDLPNAQPEDTALAMGTTFSLEPESVIMTSAKAGIGVEDVLRAVVDRLPSPKHISKDENGPFFGRIVDSWFDEHRGVVCLVQVIGGKIIEGQRISMYASVKESKDVDNRTDFSVQEIGVLTPQSVRTTSLRAGQVGYIIAGLRSTRQARIGDTMYIPVEWHQKGETIQPLEGYESAKPMLFASLYPVDSQQLDDLFAAIDKLLLNDSSVTVTREQSSSLGSGLRCGFLGFLHMEVFNQRLKDEFNVEIVMTTPSVPYVIRYMDGQDVNISSVSEWPDPERRKFEVLEPMVRVTLVTPQPYYGAMVDIVKERRGTDISTQYLDDGQVLISAFIPWQEVVCDMNDEVKHSSAGYASFNYEEAEFKEANLVKVEIAVNGEACDPLSFICHKDKAGTGGRKMAQRLKEVLSRQQFEIVIQAKVGTKIIARERIAPYRKVRTSGF